MMKRLLSLAMYVMLLAAVLAPAQSAGAQDGGNADAAHACQQGGYRDLARSDGSGFANTGECVSYAAQGGTLTVPAPEAYIQHKVIFDIDGECTIALVAVNLPPGGTYQFTFVEHSAALNGVVQGPRPYGTFYDPVADTSYFWQFVLNAPDSNLDEDEYSEETVRLYNDAGFELVKTYTYAETCPAP